MRRKKERSKQGQTNNMYMYIASLPSCIHIRTMSTIPDFLGLYQKYKLSRFPECLFEIPDFDRLCMSLPERRSARLREVIMRLQWHTYLLQEKLLLTSQAQTLAYIAADQWQYASANGSSNWPFTAMRQSLLAFGRRITYCCSRLSQSSPVLLIRSK